MRVKFDKGNISIIIREEPPKYIDWKINEELRKKNISIEPLYNENKDLVELNSKRVRYPRNL